MEREKRQFVILATYSYTSRIHYLSTLTYGNADKVTYTYDQQGRVTKETYEDADTVAYAYDNSGALATVTDSATGRTDTYYYDFTDRLMKYTESGTDYAHSVSYGYNVENMLTKVLETVNGAERSYTYGYDEDNRIDHIFDDLTVDGTAYNTIWMCGYDEYGRLQLSAAYPFVMKYSYGTTADGKPTSQVTEMDPQPYTDSYKFQYAYDANGNITLATVGTNRARYTYDSANQLTREDNQAAGKTWVWTYDDAGNILTKKEYAYTEGALGSVLSTVSYTYDTTWGDLLKTWNGKTIQSDAIGNMTSDGTWSYTWEHGRELASMSKSGTTWSYTYDANGMRTKRTNGSTTYSYVYNGSQLSYMGVGSNELYFSYDGMGNPLKVLYNGTQYHYVTNLQGDVLRILDEDKNTVVEYTYDAWGDLISTTGTKATTLGAHNPLRYRGYVYDTETGLYYLQSRYYNPSIGRFINADAFASTGQGLLGNNMFAYCRNSPVFRIDIFGTCDVQCGDENPMNDEDSNNDFGPGGVNNTASTGAPSTNCSNRTANNCLQTGGGHGNPIHKASINRFIYKLVYSGEYKAVYGNRALKTAGLNGSQQPDIIAISNDGIYEVWEFASPSQATGTAGYRALEAKIQVMQLANPTARIYEIIPWEGVAPR